MRTRGFFLAAIAVAGSFAALACGPSESNPTPPSFTTGSGTGTGGAGGAGGQGGAAGQGGAGGQGGANCSGPSGCFSCPPKTNEQFLNACTDAACSPFDNAARLPLYNGGNLPPLP